MNYKYAVGQKVKVLPYLKCKQKYKMFYTNQTNVLNPDMLKWLGETVTIAKHDLGQYEIKEDGGTWYWTDEMFEDLEMIHFGERLLGKRIVDIVDKEERQAYFLVTVRLDDEEVYQAGFPFNSTRRLEHAKIVQLERSILHEKEVIIASLDTECTLVIPLTR